MRRHPSVIIAGDLNATDMTGNTNEVIGRSGTVNCSAYCVKQQHIQTLMRSAHDEYIRDIIGASLLDGVNQKFRSFVRLNRIENMGIPILSDQDGLHITSLASQHQHFFNAYSIILTCYLSNSC